MDKRWCYFDITPKDDQWKLIQLQWRLHVVCPTEPILYMYAIVSAHLNNRRIFSSNWVWPSTFNSNYHNWYVFCLCYCVRFRCQNYTQLLQKIAFTKTSFSLLFCYKYRTCFNKTNQPHEQIYNSTTSLIASTLKNVIMFV